MRILQYFILTFTTLYFTSILPIAVSTDPEHKQVELYDGQSLFIYVATNANDSENNCTYETTYEEKKYKCIFKIADNSIKYSALEDCYPKVLNKTTGCMVNLPNYNKEDPREWELYDTQTHLKATVNFFYKADLYNEKMNIIQGGKTIQYLIIKDNPKLIKCEGIYDNAIFEIDLNKANENAIPKDGNNQNDFISRVKSIGTGLCGFHLLDVKLTDKEPCYLIATDEKNNQYKMKFSINVFSNESKEEIVNVNVGESVTLYCEDNDNCHLYNPAGEEVLPTGNRCSHSIRTITTNHLGIWKCTYGVSYSMQNIVKNIKVLAKDTIKMETWAKDVEDSMHIGCKITNYPRNSIPSFCMMTAPSGEILVVSPKIGMDRYTAKTTDLENGICGLEIQKPLLDSEKGNWKCQLDKEIGTFVTVKSKSVKNLDSYPKRIKKTVQIGEDIALSCQVPYSSPNCQIMSPSGVMYKSRYEYKSLLGECSILIKNATKENNGTWTCTYARDTGLPDDQVFIDLKVAETLLSYEVKQATMGDTVNLVCNADLPIRFCQFKAPNGMSYHLSEKSNTTIDYYGRGLEYGDCGISISKVTEKHSGTWTCITQIGYRVSDNVITANLYLQVNVPFFKRGTNVAASVGASVGVIIVLVGAGFWFWRKRRQANPNYTLAPRTSDSGSTEGIVQATGPAVLYDRENVYHIRQRNSLDAST